MPVCTAFGTVLSGFCGRSIRAVMVSHNRWRKQNEVRGSLTHLARWPLHYAMPNQALAPKSLGGSPTCSSPGEQPPLLMLHTGLFGVRGRCQML